MNTYDSPPSWRNILADQLPLLGHRNWIVVADSAYPWQTAPGVTTLATGADHLAVLHEVLNAVAVTPHVRPIIYTDAELPFLPESHAPGIVAFRSHLAPFLAGRDTRSLPHDDIIALLDRAGQSFRILLLKTTLVLPYTTIFLQLDCGYWSDEAEQALRSKIS